jgi:Fe-S-cluster containining protein
MQDRKALCGCGSGKRYGRCCYPRDRARAVGRESGRAGYQLVDGVLKVFVPLVESRGEHKIACTTGCNACCNSFVRARVPEALVIADWLREPDHAETLARFREKLPSWRERAGDAPAEMEALLARHDGAPREPGPDLDRFNELGVEYALRKNLCPFNHDGACEIYPVRPILCRVTYVLDTAEYCTPRRGGVPKVVSHPRLEEAAHEATRQFARTAERMGHSPRERALPEMVAWALDAPV